MTPRAITGEMTAERFARLTSHLRINGKPLESVLLRLADDPSPEALAKGERHNPPPPAPEEPS